MYALPLHEQTNWRNGQNVHGHTLWLSRKSRPSRRRPEATNPEVGGRISRSATNGTASSLRQQPQSHIVNNNSRSSTSNLLSTKNYAKIFFLTIMVTKNWRRRRPSPTPSTAFKSNTMGLQACTYILSLTAGHFAWCLLPTVSCSHDFQLPDQKPLVGYILYGLYIRSTPMLLLETCIGWEEFE